MTTIRPKPIRKLLCRGGLVALTLGAIVFETTLAHAITFQSNGVSAPKRSTGGASRGIQFVSGASGAPRSTTGGASRSTLFKPTPGRSVRQSTGGASRGTLFKPKGRVLRATGGASRGHTFAASGAPRQSAGGASRDGAAAVATEQNYPNALMALMPQEFYGTTLSERPSILVYMPESNAEEAIFSLKNDAGDLVYQTTLPLSGDAGVVRVQLPETIAPLEVGKNYQWLMALKIDSRLTPSTPYVDGWVQRIARTAETDKILKLSSPIAQAEALASAGIWYDCSAILAAQLEAQPENATVQKHWQDLLASVGLQSVTTAPMLQYQ